MYSSSEAGDGVSAVYFSKTVSFPVAQIWFCVLPFSFLSKAPEYYSHLMKELILYQLFLRFTKHTSKEVGLAYTAALAYQ